MLLPAANAAHEMRGVWARGALRRNQITGMAGCCARAEKALLSLRGDFRK
jgi:hypothetical protein